MAPWTFLRGLTRATVLVVAVLASLGFAADVCHNSTGECDEVGLLQHARRSGHDATVGAAAASECRPACKNGGRCILRSKYCLCNPGWRGEDCSEPTELRPPNRTHRDRGDAETCGLGFTVYPYIQPQLWGSAYDGWETCAGRRQSPINIICTKANIVSGPKLQTDYGTSMERPDHVENNGHALEVPGNFGNLTLGRLVYDTLNVHFHSPSEHTLDFKPAAMEMHIVHQDSRTGKIAVIGIFFDIGAPNACLKRAFSAPAPRAGCEKPIGRFDLSCFDEQLSGPWWSYTGSLTTPPCTEGLSWNVMKKRATISLGQLKVFKTRFVKNARPVQPLNLRQVTYNLVK